VTEHLPKDKAQQARWVITQSFKKLDAVRGKNKLRELARQLPAQRPDAAASVREGLDEVFTIMELGINL